MKEQEETSCLGGEDAGWQCDLGSRMPTGASFFLSDLPPYLRSLEHQAGMPTALLPLRKRKVPFPKCLSENRDRVYVSRLTLGCLP